MNHRELYELRIEKFKTPLLKGDKSVEDFLESFETKTFQSLIKTDAEKKTFRNKMVNIAYADMIKQYRKAVQTLEDLRELKKIFREEKKRRKC